MRVLQLPLHRTIQAGWGSESEWAVHIALGVARSQGSQLTALVGYADSLTRDRLEKHLAVVNLGVPPGYNLRSSIAFYSGIVLKGVDLLDSVRPEVVHHVFPMGFGEGFNPLLSRSLAVPYVVGPLLFPVPPSPDSSKSLEGLRAWKQGRRFPGLQRLPSYPLSRLQRRTLLGASHVLVDSGETRRIYVSRYPELKSKPFTIVPGGGVDPDFYRPAPLPDTERLIVGVLSYLRKVRNVDVLLKGVAQCGGRNVCVLVGGDGPELPALMRLAGELGIEDRVEFLGRVPRPETQSFYQRIHVLYDGIGGPHLAGASVQEAMMSGRAILASSLTHAEPKLLPYGYDVPVGNPAHVAWALTSLLEDPSTWADMAKRAHEVAISSLSDSAITKKILDVYHKVAM